MSRLTDVKITLLVKLGSIAVHAEEVLDHLAQTNSPLLPEDIGALETLLTDPEVVAWRKMMDEAAFLPKKRT